MDWDLAVRIELGDNEREVERVSVLVLGKESGKGSGGVCPVLLLGREIGEGREGERSLALLEGREIGKGGGNPPALVLRKGCVNGSGVCAALVLGKGSGKGNARRKRLLGGCIGLMPESDAVEAELL